MTLLNKSFTLNQQLHRSDKIWLKQGNKDAQTLLFTLSDGGVAIDLTACTVVFFATKPSGATLVNSCSITSATGGKVSYVVSEQTSIEAGVLTDCYLQVIKTGVVMNTFNLDVEVLASKNYDTAIATASEFTVFQAAMADLANVEQNINFAAPVGEIKLWPFSAAPAKHLLMQGAEISRTTYADLWALASSGAITEAAWATDKGKFSVGNGSTTFRLPNWSELTNVGYKSGSAEFGTLGKSFGEKAHTLSALESGTTAHTHPLNMFGDVAGSVGHVSVQGLSNAVNYSGVATANSTSAAAANAHNNLQPSVATNYIIRALA